MSDTPNPTAEDAYLLSPGPRLAELSAAERAAIQAEADTIATESDTQTGH